MSSLVARGVSKRFGDVTALDAIDLEVASGELVVVIGGSGSGKSTLLRLLAGLDSPTSGRIEIDGADVTGLEPAKRGIGMVFQSYALYPHLTVAENIGFPLRVAKLTKRDVQARVAEVAALLDLGHLLQRRPRELSGGQRQRVAIGRAVVRRPKILLLDEPLSNLDAALRVRMRHLLARLHQELGTTMIYVTHDQAEGMTLANRIVVMEQARIEQVGPPLEVYEHPRSLTVATAIGSPAMNLLPVTIVRADAAGVAVRLCDRAELRIPLTVPPTLAGTPATLGVRPEHLVASAGGPFAGPIELFERLGPLSFVHLGMDGRTIVAQLPGDAQATLGERLAFTAAPGKAQLFDQDGAAFARISP